ncbi:unnamed protein product, partial [marine sediment metagenome]
RITTFSINDATGAIIGIIDTQTVSYWEGGGLHGWARSGFMCLGPNNHIVVVFGYPGSSYTTKQPLKIVRT